jgi:2-oxoglutarate ferredoxin oxidoreductase subunit delta
MSETPKKSYVHTIRERYCKGCGICVAFCPKKVLALREGKVFAERADQCVGCRMCELRCPDYAIELREAEAEAEAAARRADPDFSLPPEAMHD